MSGRAIPTIADNGTDTALILRELNHAKVAFQLRTITLVLGSQPPVTAQNGTGGIGEATLNCGADVSSFHEVKL